jgi:MYXO-CTERM domain-containing protein
MTLLALALPALGATWIVDAGGSGDATTIMGGIALAASGDSIEVLPGTYVEDIDFQAKTLVIVGSGPDATILEGTGAGPVVRIDSGEGAGTWLGGMTIRGGSAASESTTSGGGVYAEGVPVTLDTLRFTGNTASFGGGAMLWETPGAVVNECDFEENTGTVGAGLYVLRGSATITTSRFTGNAAIAEDSADGAVGGYGGGLIASGAQLTITDTTFSANNATLGGAGLYALDTTLGCVRCTVADGAANGGAGAWISRSAATFEGSALTGNVAAGSGGGIYATTDATVTLASTSLTDNQAEYGAGLLGVDATFDMAYGRVDGNAATAGGGGVYLLRSGGTLTNVVVAGNVAQTANGGGVALDASTLDATASIFALNNGLSGGAVHVNDGSVATLTNLTITENASSNSAGGIRVTAAGGLTLTNTVIGWSTDGSGISAAAGATPAVRYGDLYENEGGPTNGFTDPTGTNGNVSVNPEFMSFADDGAFADDLHLAATSPLRDAGDPTILDADGSTSDIGAYGGPNGGLWEAGDGDVDGYSAAEGDCDDADAAVNPGVAADGCGGGDEDCDGETDEDCGGDTGDIDTGTPGDTDTDADTTVDADTDADGTKDGGDGGCGCASEGGAAPMLGLVAVGLVAARRRRS